MDTNFCFFFARVNRNIGHAWRRHMREVVQYIYVIYVSSTRPRVYSRHIFTPAPLTLYPGQCLSAIRALRLLQFYNDLKTCYLSWLPSKYHGMKHLPVRHNAWIAQHLLIKHKRKLPELPVIGGSESRLFLLLFKNSCDEYSVAFTHYHRIWVWPLQRMPKTNTRALKITYSWHVHFPEFEFVKTWIKYTSVRLRQRGNLDSLKFLQSPQKRQHVSWVFLSQLIFKRYVSFIHHTGQLILIRCFDQQKNKIIFSLNPSPCYLISVSTNGVINYSPPRV